MGKLYPAATSERQVQHMNLWEREINEMTCIDMMPVDTEYEAAMDDIFNHRPEYDILPMCDHEDVIDNREDHECLLCGDVIPFAGGRTVYMNRDSYYSQYDFDDDETDMDMRGEGW